MVEEHRFCVYCGKRRCRCRYKEGWNGAEGASIETVSAQSTIGDMRRQLEFMLADLDDDALATWQLSYTLTETAEGEPVVPEPPRVLRFRKPRTIARIKIQ